MNRKSLVIATGLLALSAPTILPAPAGLAAPAWLASHACWLVTSPLSRWLMTQFGPVTALGLLAALAGAGALVALRLWPAGDPDILEHTHDNLPLDHPHLKGARHHAHPFVVDDRHPLWSSQL